MNAIAVREVPGVFSLKLTAPLPRSCEEWEPVVSAVHHACLGRDGSDGVIIELEGVRRITSIEMSGIVRCLINVTRTAEAPCRVRIVSASAHVRKAFEICDSNAISACATHEAAVAELSPGIT